MQGRKAPGRSGSRSSNISKVSNSGVITASRTSITASAQDICSSSQLTRLEEDASETLKHTNNSPIMTVTSAALSSSAQRQKKQVKRRHRRKKNSCSTFGCAEANNKQEQSDRSVSSDRSELGEKRERSYRNRRELPPHLRCSGAPQSDSSSEEEVRHEARSWSKEKARRARRERSATNGCKNRQGDIMELQSVDSDNWKEQQHLVEDSGGLQKYPNVRGSRRRAPDVSQRKRPQSRAAERKSSKSRSPRASSSVADDGEELITKKYQEKGSGYGDMSVPMLQKHCAMNGGAPRPGSDDSEVEVCRICHCEGDDECALITPCRCTGSLSFVHQACLNQWIKSSDTRCCELCKYDFIMETKLKPLSKWEKLHMSKSERRKIFCSVLFHLIAVVCMLWSVYILVKRTIEEIRLGRNDELWRVSLLKYYSPQGVLEWPFWTKLVVVAIGFTGGLVFLYIQCKVYVQLWRRLKAFNRIITVQNCPEKNVHSCQGQPGTLSNGKHETVQVPLMPVAAAAAHMDSDMSVEAAAAPVRNPV